MLLKKSNRKPFSEQQIVEEITNHFKSVVTREKVRGSGNARKKLGNSVSKI